MNLARIYDWVSTFFVSGQLNQPGCRCYCPVCRNDLTLDQYTVYWEEDRLVCYRCSECLTVSRWDFDIPVPVLMSRHLTVRDL